MGGTTGLFVGASLLSFIEIFYYFAVRPYGTMYSGVDSELDTARQDDDDDNKKLNFR